MASQQLYESARDLHRRFLQGERMERPLIGVNLGFYANDRYPSTMSALPNGPISPDDIHTDLFLQDCDRLYRAHSEIDDDYPFVASPLVYVPWMEAIMGCRIVASPSSLWAEPCESNWRHLRSHGLEPTNPWYLKLLEMMQELIAHSDGRFPLSATMMRGPADILAAMRGASQLPLDLVDEPNAVKDALDLCAEAWIEVAKAQLAVIPHSETGYLDGDRGLRLWSPRKMMWLQDDALALLSPSLNEEFLLPLHRQLASNFSVVAFHMHGSSLWAIEGLLGAPEIDVMELNFDSGNTDADSLLSSCRQIASRKPLVLWRLSGDDLEAWLDRVVGLLPCGSLSIQVTVGDLEEAGELTSMFRERQRAWHWHA